MGILVPVVQVSAAADVAALRARHAAATAQAQRVLAHSTMLLHKVESAPWRTSETTQHRRRLEAEIAGLRAALESRATIEQAKGIVMATMHCTADEAFDLLKQQSQYENRKLREIARDLVISTSRRPIPS